MIKYLLIMVFLMLPSLCCAGGWSTKDTILEAVSEGLTVVDWGQTNNIRDHSGMIELNPILGRSPSRGAVNAYFGTWLAIHPLISYVIPSEYRTIWQSIYIGVELTAVGSNYKSGLRLSF